MSKGTLDRSTFETIENYVLERMDLGERMAFEQRMAGDAALRAEVELERENIRAVELGGVTRMLRGIAVDDDPGRSGGNWSRYLKYAAVIAVLAAAGVWWSLRPTLNERLFTEHFSADPGLPVVMGATDDPAFADAMISYKEGRYADARAKWALLLRAAPENDTLRYYMASAWLAEGDVREALPLLNGLAMESTSVFHGKARWFLFLASVRLGETEKARSMDLESDTTYGLRVRKIMSQLGN